MSFAVAMALRDMRTLSYSEISEQTSRNFGGVEIFFSDGARSQTVPPVVTVNLIDRGNRLFDGRNGEKPFTRRQDIAEAGVLSYDRLAASQIFGVALAEPSAPKPNIHILGDGKFSARSAEVSRIIAEYV